MHLKTYFKSKNLNKIMKNTRRIMDSKKRRKVIRSTGPTQIEVRKFATEHQVPEHIAERALWTIKNKNLLLTNKQAIKQAEVFWKKFEKIEAQMKKNEKLAKK